MNTGPGSDTEARGAAWSRTDSRWRGWKAQGRTLVFALVAVAGLWITVTPVGEAGRLLQLALAALAVAGLLSSKRWPVLAVLVVAAATATALLLGLAADPFVLTGFALFTVAERRGSRRFPWWMLAGAAIVMIASLGLDAKGVEDVFRGLILSAGVLSAAWVLGVRTRQARVEAAARSRAEERLRLARDVHDVLSHSLGTIGVRAGVAAHVTSLHEPELRGLLREIEQDARGSLAELRELLARERGPGDMVFNHDERTSPSLTAVLAGIVRSAESAGIRTALDVVGAVDDLPAAVRTTVHRVVQEAVANVIRHASASSLVVAVRESDDFVRVEVQDDGRGAAADIREGHGLAGMRERVALIDGRLDIAVTPAGWTVSAILPSGMTSGDVS
ncbi:MAG: sensor histidine kinase [Microbacterium sp.]|nr:sensor histidine kinase [Microbacterium sp.]